MTDDDLPTRAPVGSSGPNEPEPDDAEDQSDAGRPPLVVGIAASAGGLEAASLLVQNLPVDLGVTYVLAQHMSPTHKSLLSKLLGNETQIPVIELSETDDVVPCPDTIYVPRPNFDVLIENGRVCLRPQPGSGGKPKPSADRLFKSMAEELGERCVGIVLSGTGSDGSYGVQAIREAGGITIAQDVGTAKYDGMPASALETGCIDLQLSPQQIGLHLAKILSAPHDLTAFQNINDIESPLGDLMQILLARTGVNFRDYRENTVNRRIARRMTALGIADYDDYVAHCRASVKEVDALHRDLLISVTRFFRDHDQFEQLGEVLREKCRHLDGDKLRIWIAGCATGEEAYSIAILVVEAMGGLDALSRDRVQIFATDIDERALSIARKGVYPQTALNDIPDAFVDRYFRLYNSKIEVLPALRQIVLFSHHNLIQDPPFINLDLVSLRNVMIYFKVGLQERVLTRLHYALNAGGHLFLGTSEAIGAMDGFFETAKDYDKLFVKRDIQYRVGQRTGLGAMQREEINAMRSVVARQKRQGQPPESDMFDVLARAVAPNGFMVTRNNDIVRVFGDISALIEVSEQSSLTALNTSILRRGLREEATSLTSLPLRAKATRTGRWHRIEGSGFNEVCLTAYPLVHPTSGEAHVLIAVQTRLTEERSLEFSKLTPTQGIDYIREIEGEMAAANDRLEQTVEELQTSNEQLQTVNEELQSANEELQATNEEMETANEELQSTNEELITVNEEMQINATELEVISTEMLAVLDAVPLPVLVIDHALQIRRASRTAREFFRIDALTAVGVHLTQCTLPEGIPPLTPIVSDVFRLREPADLRMDVKGLLRQIKLTPFSRRDGEILGVTLVVSEFDNSDNEALSELMSKIGGFSHWRYDVADDRLFWSDEVFRIHGLPAGSPVPDVAHAIDFYTDDTRERLKEAFETCLREGRPFTIVAAIDRPTGERVPVQSDAVAVRAADGTVTSVVGTFKELPRN